MLDYRLEQVVKIISAIISKKNLYCTNMMLTEDNTLYVLCMSTVLYVVQLKDVQPGFAITCRCDDLVTSGDICPIQNPEDRLILENEIFRYINHANNQNNLVAFDEFLRCSEEYENLLAMKSAEGNRFYNIRGCKDITKVYFVPVFSGFPISINKSDTLGISVYDMYNGFILIKYNVFKKKLNRVIDIYYKTIDLNKSQLIH